jgi:predicted nucleotidyltransferase component of viral defense system
MLDISTIKKQYPNLVHKFDRSLLREYLQFQILEILFSNPLSRKLTFLGGTCLRIVHQLPRFSEDIDFDNKNLTESEFAELSTYLEKELEKRGFIVETKIVAKGAFHCHIKFPKLLFEQGITPQKYEKILIQVDTFDQGVEYQPDIFILDKFEFFTQIRVTPKSIILSQKLWTITQRPRLKGRDFFDIMFLLQTTKPDAHFLQSKFGKKSVDTIISEILKQLEETDWQTVINDVKPFLFEPGDAEKIRLFPQFLKQKLG